MAVTGLNFAAQAEALVNKTKARMDALFRQSAQDTVGIMQSTVSEGGAMPVQTGFLRSSLQAVVNGDPVPADQPSDGLSHAYNAGPINLVINGAAAGDEIVTSYSANYAGHVEYGTSKMQARGFIRLAALQWQQVVDRNVAKLNSGQ